MEYLKIGVIFAAILTNIFLGFLALSKNPHNTVNRMIAAFAAVFALWSISLLLYDYPLILSSLFWIKVTYLIVIYGIVYLMFLMGFIFPDGKNRPPLWGQLSYFFLASILAYTLIFTDSFVKEVVETATGRQTSLGSMYLPFIIFDSIFGYWGIGLLIYKYLHNKGRTKAQLKYLFSGLILFVVCVLLLDSIIPILKKDTSFFSISTAGSLFFVGFTTYAIVKYRFLDIRIALQEVLAFCFTTISLATICYLGAIAYWVLNNMPLKYGVIIVVLVISALLSLIFNKLVYLSRLLVSAVMRQPFYDFEKTVLQVSLGLTTTLDFKQLVESIFTIFTKQIGVQKVALVLRDQTSYQVIKRIGFEQEFFFLEDGFLTAYIEKNLQMIVEEEVMALVERSNDENEKYHLRQLANHLEVCEVALVLPLIGQNKLLGMIILGDKQSGDPYTVQDIDLITTVNSQFINALENAISFAKIKQFNVTLRREIEKATHDLQQANLRLEQLDRLKDDFVSVASHELRTPMTAIRSYSWMALHRSDVTLSERMKKYLSRTLISTERLINLVNDMLNISRIESGRININPSVFDIIRLCQDIVAEVEAKAREKSLKLSVLSAASLPKLFADPDKVHQVLLNLVGNSLKFTPAGGEIDINFISDGLMMDISVKDTGVGINQDDLSHLFKKFGRLDYSYSALASSGGTGLGLYISKSLVELMGGKIWASTGGLGKGATFTFSLPIANQQNLLQANKFTQIPRGEAKTLEPVAI